VHRQKKGIKMATSGPKERKKLGTKYKLAGSLFKKAYMKEFGAYTPTAESKKSAKLYGKAFKALGQSISISAKKVKKINVPYLSEHLKKVDKSLTAKLKNIWTQPK
jgi:hypothetical protein